MAGESAFEFEGNRSGRLIASSWNHLVEIFNFPDLCGMVGRAGRQVFDVRGEKDAGDVLAMRFEMRYGYEGGFLAILYKMPDKDITLMRSV